MAEGSVTELVPVEPMQALPDHERHSNVPQTLLEISNRIATFRSLDQQLIVLVDALAEALGAERGTLFLYDTVNDELYSHVAQGNINREIRLERDKGIAGYVFTNGESVLIDDPYSDPRFDASVDQATGFRTRNICCAPVRTLDGETIGVAQALNSRHGTFTQADLRLLEAISQQASITIQNTIYMQRMEDARAQEADFLNIVAGVASEINLGPLLQMIINAITTLLEADRTSLFLNDEKTQELFTHIGQGLETSTIRIPNSVGIAGTVFTSGKTVNIPHAYADLRFNPSFDKQTGYFTRSILCVPVANKEGKIIGVTQVLNKRGGPFSAEDEARLKAFTSQISMALENAKLFSDVQAMKNYNESMLESMSSAVLTFDDELKVVTCNSAGTRIMKIAEEEIVGADAETFFSGENSWIFEGLKNVAENQDTMNVLDASAEFGEETLSINLTIQPLTNDEEDNLGCMLMMEDISSEKRVRSTMARYMDATVADQLLKAGGTEILGGASSEATVMFSDIRSFTTLSEELGAQGIVSLLNDYFTEMVDCIADEGGMLDKFIGDAIMAIFGTPLPHEDDPDRAVRTAIQMMQRLEAFNRRQEQNGKRGISIGIGLNTGNVVSGNVGSPKRMDYTVIGDAVNLAARLESATKQYGAHVLISEFTYRGLRGTYRMREVDRLVVKGKTEPVAIYEVMDVYGKEEFPNVVDVCNRFRDGLGLYRARNWPEAIREFEAALKLHAGDKASQLYIERSQHLIANPPSDEWDGVWIMETK